jgi:hypothetical protein
MSTGLTKVVAKDLTPEEQQARAEHCHELHTQIVASLRAGRSAAWAFAKAIYEFDEASGWSALNYETLNEYLADPDVALGRSTYFAAKKRYDKIVVQRQIGSDRLDSLDPSKVDVVLPALEQGKVKLAEALDDVEALGKRDLREKYFGRKEPAPEPVDPPEDDEDDYVPPPMNDGNDTPKLASSIVIEADEDEDPEPAHNDLPEVSGQVQVVADAAAEVEAREVLKWLDMALGISASGAVKLEALRKAKKFVSSFVPDATDGDDS